MRQMVLTMMLTATLATAGTEQIFTGVVTDSMCGGNHDMMNITPVSKCVRDCAKPGSGVKYALFDGKNTYRLSDQETPARFAGQRVTITGTLFAKTGIIQAKKIEPAK